MRLVQEKHLLPPEVHSRLRRACGLPAGGWGGGAIESRKLGLLLHALVQAQRRFAGS